VTRQSISADVKQQWSCSYSAQGGGREEEGSGGGGEKKLIKLTVSDNAIFLLPFLLIFLLHLFLLLLPLCLLLPSSSFMDKRNEDSST